MSVCGILNGLKAGMKCNMGGIKKVWIYPYIQYPSTKIITDGSVLISHPPTQIFLFEHTNELGIIQSQQKTLGGKFTNFTITLETTSREVLEIEKLMHQESGIIVLDRNNNYLIFGVRNGLNTNSITQVIGNTKSDFNGYRIEFEGKEIDKAFFINDLAEAGFSPYPLPGYMLLQDSDYLLLQNGDILNLIN
jgi:hypothetical protein